MRTARTPKTRAHEAQLVAIDSLKPYPGNARTHDLPVIRESLRVNGQYRPVVVRARTRHVLAGNGTLEAAIEEGRTEVWATFVDCDAKAARRINLVDNRANDLAGWDEQALAAQLGDLPGVEGTGWSERELVSFVAKVNGAGEDTEPVEPPKVPRTKPGDLWVLGEHRLLRGDATVDMERLMGGERAAMVWTDPPYGVNVTGGTHDPRDKANYGRGGKVTNDGLSEDETERLWREVAGATAQSCLAGAAWYSAAPPGPLHLRFARVLDELGILRQMLVWVKPNFVFGRSDYHYRHEPIMYGWVPGASRPWVAGRDQDTVLEFASPPRDMSHPTMKPTELIEHCVGNSSDTRVIVLDPFAGSGSTLIACENLSRRCYAMEIDPGYCDVIVDRWQRHTGKQATRGG